MIPRRKDKSLKGLSLENFQMGIGSSSGYQPSFIMSTYPCEANVFRLHALSFPFVPRLNSGKSGFAIGSCRSRSHHSMRAYYPAREHESRFFIVGCAPRTLPLEHPTFAGEAVCTPEVGVMSR